VPAWIGGSQVHRSSVGWRRPSFILGTVGKLLGDLGGPCGGGALLQKGFIVSAGNIFLVVTTVADTYKK
jgi:hypothetical protein